MRGETPRDVGDRRPVRRFTYVGPAWQAQRLLSRLVLFFDLGKTRALLPKARTGSYYTPDRACATARARFRRISSILSITRAAARADISSPVPRYANIATRALS